MHPSSSQNISEHKANYNINAVHLKKMIRCSIFRSRPNDHVCVAIMIHSTDALTEHRM